MIRASIEKGSPLKALLDYKTLLLSGLLQPDYKTISSVLEACKMLNDLKTTLGTHSRIIKSGFDSNPSLLASLVVIYAVCDHTYYGRQVYEEIPEWGFNIFSANVLIASYLKLGEFDEANRIFRKMHSRDVVSWNSMIMGCVRNARSKEAISLFCKMIKSGFKPDGFSFASVLTACSRTGALSHGEWAHGLMVEKGIETNFILNSALIDMYSKCGNIGLAKNVFNSVCRDDVSVWNAMVTGLAIHGLALDAMTFFSRMKDENVLPDSITFVGLLTACSHCGLVEEGQRFFESMKRQYFIEPQLEHYGAMVDLLGRAGRVREAYRMIKDMPMKPDVVIWRALLSACKTQGMPNFGEVAVKEISHLESGDYILMSNMYSSARRWDNAEKLREVMKKKGVRKNRGLSWIEMGNIIHQFKAGDRSHPESNAIYRVLDGLIKRIKLDGFVPAMELVLMDVSEEEKESNLNGHSEKLATAYGILRTSPGTEIKISKNLRTCYDCHSWMKMVSKVLNRVIIMRDRIRFHRFESGSCTCKDYW
ncbi:Pentatricopeptide repeat-containing protein [Thalictrum thalictroides]|uniref:Pentatricopeptide repeat-containing protein n=1 Tax=Thalictrum thalictroides TaxID=46969 RepID=A0A7J6V4S3_THATH|nr:Pentatricopeptide repeat-containing protein [Thalictrum thalictroides]